MMRRSLLFLLLAVCLMSCTTAAAPESEESPETAYRFPPEEIMFLTGIRNTRGQQGAAYSLCDLDGDEISELFVRRDGEGSLTVCKYDPSTDSAAVDDTLTGDKVETFLKDLEENGHRLLWVDDRQWVDSSIIGVAKTVGDPGARNDYYLSAGYDWLSEEHIAHEGETVAPTNDPDHIVEQKKEKMLTDTENYQGEDIQRLRDYYDLAVDWDSRNKSGVEPVRKYLEAVQNVSTLSGLTELLADPDLDPFCIFMTLSVTLDEKDTSSWALQIDEDQFSILPRYYHTLGSEDIEAEREDCTRLASHVLARTGFSEEEIGTVMTQCYEIEDFLLDYAWPSEDGKPDELSGFLPYDTVTESCRNFPLRRILEAYHITKGKICVTYPEYLRQLDHLYTEENLQKLKSYLIVHTAYAACPYLDQEAVMQMWTDDTDLSKEEILERLEQDYKREVMSPRELMGVAEENAYMTFFVDPALRADLMERADRIKEVFREMLSNEEWLSDAGKKAAIEKLDNMHFQILRPDTLIDTSYLSVDLSASFLENYAGLCSRTLKHKGSFAGRMRDPAEWRYDLRPEIATTVANAFYYGTFNQFFILDGFIPEDLYCLDMSEEEKLAGIGEIIGHELTHGFDPEGIRFDKDGNMVQTKDNPYGWMTKEDHEAFQKRAAKLADYFDDIIPFPYSACSGETVKGEAAADIAGMSICLKIAENIEDFDYDFFFRKHALLWMKQDSLVNERGDITDAHPLPHLRINTTVQQFDEFLDTYGVEEGDGMYLAPEERVVIW